MSPTKPVPVGVSDVSIQAGSAGVVRLLGAVGKDGSGSISPLKSLVVSAGGGIVIGGGIIASIINALIGAIILLVIYGFIKKRS